jgi:hypothetical protein
LTLKGAPSLKIERDDWVEVLGLENAEIGRLEAAAVPSSRIDVAFAGRATSVRHGKTLGTLSKINPTLIETIAGAGRVKAFKFACELAGSICGILGALTGLKSARRAQRGKHHARSKKVHAG